jgi:hypothetical protein
MTEGEVLMAAERQLSLRQPQIALLQQGEESICKEMFVQISG